MFVRFICTCLFFGLMWAEVWMMSKDRDAREDADQNSRQTLQQIVTNTGLLSTQITTESGNLAEINTKLAAAREKHDPQEIRDLEHQVLIARQKVDETSQQLLLSMVQPVINQLMDYYYRWYRDEGRTEAEFDLNPSSHSHDDYLKAARQMATSYSTQMRPVMLTANSLRQQLLNVIPSSEQTNIDKEHAAKFSKIVAGDDFEWGDVADAARYLRG
jgi:uncharacterized protein YydD (DUF2326 family)